jgi:predicted lactoylglutathione lyase
MQAENAANIPVSEMTENPDHEGSRTKQAFFRTLATKKNAYATDTKSILIFSTFMLVALISAACFSAFFMASNPLPVWI